MSANIRLTYRGPNVSAICLTLAAAIAALVAVMWMLRLFVYDAVPAPAYTIVAALVFVPSLAAGFWRGPVPPWALLANLAGCIVAVTIGIHFGGGVDNVSGPLLYALLIGLAGLVGSGRGAFAAAFGSTVLYGLLVWGERHGVLTHHLSYTKSGDDAVATIVALGTYLFLVAWMVSYTVAQIHAAHRRMDELRTEAVTALSHDLKNPLGVIHSAADLAASGSASEIPEHLERIHRAAQTAIDLVHNVLDAAALEHNMLQPHIAPIDLGRLLAEVVDLYAPAASARGVRVTTELSDGLPRLEGDQQMLGRALGNLLSNALKFSPAGGDVAIRTFAYSGGVAIEVRDSGCGIRAADRPRLFQRFSRIEPAVSYEGTGLGLYIVRAIAEAHGGRVRVDDAIPAGTIFTIELPVRRYDP